MEISQKRMLPGHSDAWGSTLARQRWGGGDSKDKAVLCTIITLYARNNVQVNAVNKRFKGAFLSFEQFEEVLKEFEKKAKPPKNQV